MCKYANEEMCWCGVMSMMKRSSFTIFLCLSLQYIHLQIGILVHLHIVILFHQLIHTSANLLINKIVRAEQAFVICNTASWFPDTDTGRLTANYPTSDHRRKPMVGRYGKIFLVEEAFITIFTACLFHRIVLLIDGNIRTFPAKDRFFYMIARQGRAISTW